jgi:hypothetical protein
MEIGWKYRWTDQAVDGDQWWPFENMLNLLGSGKDKEFHE